MSQYSTRRERMMWIFSSFKGSFGQNKTGWLLSLFQFLVNNVMHVFCQNCGYIKLKYCNQFFLIILLKHPPYSLILFHVGKCFEFEFFPFPFYYQKTTSTLVRRKSNFLTLYFDLNFSFSRLFSGRGVLLVHVTIILNFACLHVCKHQQVKKIHERKFETNFANTTNDSSITSTSNRDWLEGDVSKVISKKRSYIGMEEKGGVVFQKVSPMASPLLYNEENDEKHDNQYWRSKCRRKLSNVLKAIVFYTSLVGLYSFQSIFFF